MGKFQDLTQQKFGHLTVKYRGENSKNKQTRWWCECDCGNPDLVLVYASHLKDGHTTSCGCYHLKTLKEKNKKYNKYNLDNNYGIGYCNDGTEFYFDLEDYDKIKDYYWWKDKDGYLCSYYKNDNNKKTTIKMHRIIMGAKDSIFIDHILGEDTRNDNRKYNLRFATVNENNENHKLRRDNTSGVTGVGWDKKSEKWRARISINNKEICLGYYNELSQAIKVRKEAEEKYFGEWSYDNSQILGNIRKKGKK